MKRVLSVILCTVMVLGLCSCEGDSPVGPEEAASLAEQALGGLEEMTRDDSGKSGGKTGSNEDNQSEGSGGSQSGSGSQSGEEGSGSGQSASKVVEGPDYHFYSKDQAEHATEFGVQEYRAYTKGDSDGSHSRAIEDRYVNRYLRPYLEFLSKEQLLVEPESVQSDWFKERNPVMSAKVGSGASGNVYRKMAQDMLPYMLPDPDDMVRDLLDLYASYGMTGATIDKRIDAAEILKDYEEYDPMESESSWSYDWEKFNRDFHYCYMGSSYGASGNGGNAGVGLISPSYNEAYKINYAVFGEKDYEKNKTTIAPHTDAGVLLTELQDLRELEGEPEYYIQEIRLSVEMPTKDQAQELLRKAFAIVQPYNTEENRLEILKKSQDPIYVPLAMEDWSGGNVTYTYEMLPYYQGHEELLKFDQAILFNMQRDYTPTYAPDPMYNVKINCKNPYSPGYYTDSWLSYFNHTCDVHVDYQIDEYDNQYTNTYWIGLHIRYAGPVAYATNLRAEKYDGWSWTDTYGLYYPLTVPIFYNEAAKNGYFTPYVIPAKREEGSLDGVIPAFESVTPAYTQEAPYVNKNEQESERERMNRWLSEGFGEDKHTFPPHAKDREKVDWSGRNGYTGGENGTWIREMETKSPDGGNLVTKHTLTYDETGLLTSGYMEYKDGSYRTIDYRTDIDGNPVNAVERIYNKDGTMTNQMFSRIDRGGNVTSRDLYSTTMGPSGYQLLESVSYNSDGEVTDWTAYNENGSPKARKTTVSWQEIGGTTGNPVTVTYTRVTETTHDEQGNVLTSSEKQYAKQDAKVLHTLQDYLLNMSLIQSEWF